MEKNVGGGAGVDQQTRGGATDAGAALPSAYCDEIKHSNYCDEIEHSNYCDEIKHCHLLIVAK